MAFDDLLASELAAVDGKGERVSLSGPPGIRLRANTVQNQRAEIRRAP
jgi:hypothetical protein